MSKMPFYFSIVMIGLSGIMMCIQISNLYMDVFVFEIYNDSHKLKLITEN